MGAVWNILWVTFPFFALVLAGFGAARRRLLPLEAIPGLNGFVLYFALPAMLFRFGASTPLAQLLDGAVLGVYLFCALVMVALAVAATLTPRVRWNDAALGALVAAFPNTGFMGVPLLAALLGPQSVGTVILLVVIDMVVTSSLCIALSRLDQRGAGAWAAVKQALRGVAANPMPWAILGGAVVSGTGAVLPAPVLKTIGLLADAASPVALFTIGAVLARAQLHNNPSASWSGVWPLALMKLVLHPVLVWAVATLATRWGAPLAPLALTTMVLVAALPSASNVSLLAERFGADSARIARVIMLSTAVAFWTFSAAVAWLA